MKIISILISSLLILSCSFDNKSGIWNNEKDVIEEKDILGKLETLTSLKKSFDKTIILRKNFSFENFQEVNNTKWHDIFYNSQNNFENYSYENNGKLIFESKKISRNSLNNFILYENKNIIINDKKGNIFVYSIDNNNFQSKFNFYRKKFKRVKKALNLVVENNIIYVSDNIGFLYAFDYKKNKILWAKNYKVPFRSNLKIINKTLIAANQNNILYFFDKFTGDVIKLFPTEEILVNNEFKNNLSTNKSNSFFLNTYGSLYSIDNNNFKINWFVNLNQSINLNPSNLFFGNQIVSDKRSVVVSSNQYTYILDAKTGSILYKKNFSSKIKPFIINNYLFCVTKKNFLISMNLQNGEILYSYDINQKIAKYLNSKKRNVEIQNIFMAKNKILIFLANSYVLEFSIEGKLQNISKLKSKIKSNPIFIQDKLIYINKKNKFLVIN